MEESQIKVFVRFKHESNVDSQLIDLAINLDGQSCNIVKNQIEKQFKVQKMLDPDTSQQNVFDEVALPQMDYFLEGINSTIFTYGQTGSGKTYTMIGPDNVVQSLIHKNQIQEDNQGIIPRIVQLLFGKLEAKQQKYQMFCSYLEVYNEGLYDLLTPKSNEKLKIREDQREGVVIMGLTETNVNNPSELMSQIQIGLANCSFATTCVNARSSRSHTVLMIKLLQKNEEGQTLMSKLNLVDLAGSERISKSKTSGQQLQETKKINQSLTTLGQCIISLSSKNKTHIPFRDSKLTFILKQSLGGNTKTSLICTCSQLKSNEEETISTLRFAQRALKIILATEIRPNIQKNSRELEKLVKFLQEQVEKLKLEIQDQSKLICDLELEKQKNDFSKEADTQSSTMQNLNNTDDLEKASTTDGGDEIQQSHAEIPVIKEPLDDDMKYNKENIVKSLDEFTWEELQQQRLDISQKIKEIQLLNKRLNLKILGIDKNIEQKEHKIDKIITNVQITQDKYMDFKMKYDQLKRQLHKVQNELQCTQKSIQIENSMSPILIV